MKSWYWNHISFPLSTNLTIRLIIEMEIRVQSQANANSLRLFVTNQNIESDNDIICQVAYRT